MLRKKLESESGTEIGIRISDILWKNRKIFNSDCHPCFKPIPNKLFLISASFPQGIIPICFFIQTVYLQKYIQTKIF